MNVRILDEDDENSVKGAQWVYVYDKKEETTYIV